MATEGNGPGENPGLFGSLRSFWGVLLAILYTRLDLLTAELQDEAGRAVKLLIAGFISLVAFAGAFFFVNYIVIAAFWDTEYRLDVIGAVIGVYALIGAVSLLALMNMIKMRPPFLSQTISELRRDAEGLSRKLAQTKDGAAK